VRTPIQFAIAGLIVAALLIVVAYPWTATLPAPLLKRPAVLFALLAGALLSVLRHLLHARRMAIAPAPARVESLSERLALICTRLC
jgi:hypothetical protein